MISRQVTSAVVMGVLAATVIAAVARSRPWERYRPAPVDTGGNTRTGERGPATDETGLWVGLFLVLALGAVAGVGLFVSSAGATRVRWPPRRRRLSWACSSWSRSRRS